MNEDDKHENESGAGEAEPAADAQPKFPEKETAGVAESPVKAAPPAMPEPPPARRGGGGLVGWLALLLVLAVAAAGAWVVRQGLDREQTLAGRIDTLEQRPGEEHPERQLRDMWRQELAQSSAELSSRLDGQAEQLTALDELVQREARLLDSFTASDQETWLRAEVQYLLRLANQRVLMARDPQSALALLQSADRLLQQLDDPGLHEVRAAVAAEMAELRAVPRVDVEGIYLRLAALSEQAGKLKIFELPEPQALPEQAPADDWKGRLEHGYQQALHKLSQYIVVRRREMPVEALMDPQWEGLVRQNLRMLLEQAQVALLTGNQALYQASLERARGWVAQFFDSDEAAAHAMDTELQQLQGETVQVQLPDLSLSQQAMDAAIRQRPQQGGAE